MAISVVMPALEMAQETGRLVAWLKKEGDRVAKGDMLLEIETDKAVLEVEATADGFLAGVTGEAGADIPVGRTIAWIVAAGEKAPASAADAAVSEAKEPEPKAGMQERGAEQAAMSSSGPISPKARRLAKEAGLDLGEVRGTGPGGEILTADVQAAIDAKSSNAGEVVLGEERRTREALSSIGRLMAERTAQSWTSVPHFFLQRDVDATGLNAARRALGPAIEEAQGVKLTHTDLLIALVGRTLARHPRVNASWVQDSIELNLEINVAVAMAVEGGVASAVVSRAAQRSLGEIARQRMELTERARAGRLRPADLGGGTFTISNLGMFGIDSFSAIITPPQAAILAVGRIAERVLALGGVAAVRPVLSLTLSCDHRVLDGAKAAMFLRDLAEAIEDPEKFVR